ncbi:hypothetical protein CIHG_03757 [Coccidioides immitis H538.4]|uniref:Uncharacterized protein n=1 Tax=Coccidioides immitis H538.4 TaxID=396776 RepID=A0A0J8RLN0_COCIT|nr:hypothetical protein CIHG_03757 [Coccidioides immitis H538.4]
MPTFARSGFCDEVSSWLSRVDVLPVLEKRRPRAGEPAPPQVAAKTTFSPSLFRISQQSSTKASLSSHCQSPGKLVPQTSLSGFIDAVGCRQANPRLAPPSHLASPSPLFAVTLGLLIHTLPLPFTSLPPVVHSSPFLSSASATFQVPRHTT